MKIRIEPYKTWSGGAKALGERAGILRATRRQVDKHGDFDIIINWGRNEKRFKGRYINEPEAVVRSTDKLLSLEAFREKGVPIPDFTVDKGVAQAWIDSEKKLVVARKLLRGSSGRGIVLCGPPDNETTQESVLPAAPLYVRYVKKADEYRIHIFDGNVIDVQQKRRDTSVPDEEVNWQIRNHDNGWVFARGGINPPAVVIDAAINAVRALGLDFGAVDVGYNAKKQEACVYEVNTAPGLEGQTLDNYYGALVKKFPAIRGGMYQKRRNGEV